MLRTFFITISGIAWAAAAVAVESSPLSYNRDVRPILSNNCFLCHGRDEGSREAGLRLDLADHAYAELDSGMRAIVPGEPEESELLARITTDDPSMKMPPEESHKQLTVDEIATLRRWIAEGAEYQQHWSFIPPERPEIPTPESGYRVAGPIDAFIARRLAAVGLPQAETADRRTLIRRLALDLTGLPPTLQEIEQFVNDPRDDAYQRLVERLFASPHYGERMALGWLDAARYADTHGYHIDSHRDMWPWRDWVIDAFNENMPFDQFTVWQLAGDLLPDATRDQRVASGFHRNHGINFEGGAIPEEYRVEYVADRVNTTGTVWLGLTVGCARCHDHKYDPISQAEYFRLFAFYNTIDEQGLDGQRGNAIPAIELPTPEQTAERERLDHAATQLAERLAADDARLATLQEAWEAAQAAGEDHAAIELGPWYQLPPLSEETAAVAIERDHIDPQAITDPAKPVTVDGKTLVWEERPGWIDGNLQQVKRDRTAFYLYRRLSVEHDTEAQLSVGATDAIRVWLNGRQILSRDDPRPTPTCQHEIDLPLPAGENHLLLKVTHISWECEFYTALRSPDGIGPPPAVMALINQTPNERSEAEQTQLASYFRAHATGLEDYQQQQCELYRVRRRLAELNEQIATTMVMQEQAEPRMTHRLERGQYDSPAETLTPMTPAALPPLPADGPPNRLALARWLVAPDHPLTARVTVNRLWQQLFGAGLVATSEDFGAQGAWPSHPELLDWLALELVDSGWDIQHVLRLIVTSETYQQESHATDAKLAVDRENALLSRGPRKRLPAELIRDVALSASGLLNPQIGGPSVKPYQPPGLWAELAHQKDNSRFTAQVFEADEGEKLYRRGLYTFWKRSVPPPNMVAFDAPNREVCMVRRETTNTPLQALVLLNDPVFVEAARALAERVLKEAPAEDAERVDYAMQLTTARRPTAEETTLLLKELRRQQARYAADQEAAEQLLGVGPSARDPALPAAEHAAWTNVASLLLNLDETITKE